VALARAFLKDAPLVLLDEATSQLDGESAQAIREALVRLMRGRTVIAITHRLSTVSQFDRVLVIQSGALVQDGAPADLAGRSGPYRDLLNAGERISGLAADKLNAA
jgi:ATP-binding cassette subfamily B protein